MSDTVENFPALVFSVLGLHMDTLHSLAENAATPEARDHGLKVVEVLRGVFAEAETKMNEAIAP